MLGQAVLSGRSEDGSMLFGVVVMISEGCGYMHAVTAEMRSV